MKRGLLVLIVCVAGAQGFLESITGLLSPGMAKFTLHTRQGARAITNGASARTAGFKSNTMTYFFAHGWFGAGSNFYVTQMKDAILKKYDANFIVVDWSKGSRNPIITLATNNAAQAGREVATLIKSLESVGLQRSQVHLIGHSMGGVVMGVAGRNVQSPKVARITGLDPYFPPLEPSKQLKKGDCADFVDIIHTTVAAFKQAGDVDFYPNGGKLGSLLTWLKDHMQAVFFFTKSINGCQYPARACSDYSAFTANRCARNAQNHMGIQATNSGARGKVFLTVSNTLFGC